MDEWMDKLIPIVLIWLMIMGSVLATILVALVATFLYAVATGQLH